ncbi:EI24 domain-containing protein [Undibacterium umbellatum]|nr:EI24 domain-containing protein [Undibacterium umbellatum]
MNMASVMRAWGRALAAQMHYRMLLLTLLPFVVAFILCGVLMYLGLQEAIDFVHAWMMENNGFSKSDGILAKIGLLSLKVIIGPFVAMWVLLPIMVFTSLLCIAMFAMPAINKHVGTRDYPDLEQKNGGTLLGSIWHSLSSFGIFIIVWLVTLPLNLIPFVSLVLQPLLWGWLTYRVMVYDALALHADAEERASLVQEHRWSLLCIGIVAGLFGAAPGLLWLGGAMWVVLLPVMAGAAIWIYILVFVFTGLWFQHYCLESLQRHRTKQAAV